MIRTTLLALAAVVALGAALVPSSASAFEGGWGWRGGHHPHHHGFYGHRRFHGGYGAYGRHGGYGGGDGCFRRRVIPTPYGPAVRWINVCAY